MTEQWNTCAADQCERKARSPRSTYCSVHYHRLRRAGELATASRVPGIIGPCTVEDCEKTARSSGSPYCEMHYHRLRRSGTLDARPQHKRTVCSVDDCDDPEQYLGMCAMHSMRVRRHGDPDVVIRPSERNQPSGSAHPMWSGDNVGYTAIHDRLKAAKGPASNHVCVDCGLQAKQWSYDRSDPNEHTEDVRGPYSIDLERYTPRCVPCHKRFDLSFNWGAA